MSKTLIIASEKYRYLFEKSPLPELYKTIFIPENPNVDKRLSGHTDLSLFKLDDRKLIAKEYLKGSAALSFVGEEGLDIIYDSSPQSEIYPYDCGLNAAIIGNSLVCCKKATSQKVFDECSQKGYNNIYVNQGYIKCSLCAINENAAITSDPGIYKTLSQKGYDMLFIKPETILLDGFDHGFFGGCAFMPDSSTLCLTGKLCDKDDENKLISFTAKHGIKLCYLSCNQICDIGGCIVINK